MSHFYRWIFCLFIFITCSVQAQESEILIDNNFSFKEGIYSSIDEILTNTPKYLGCRFEMVIFPAGYPKFSYYDSKGDVHPYRDSLFAVVENGNLYLWDPIVFYKSYRIGRISIILPTTWHCTSQISSNSSLDTPVLCDFTSGKFMSVSFKNVSSILINDQLLYEEFMKTKGNHKPATLLYFVNKYNSNHLLYLKKIDN
jgi:hypothetical protein